MNEFETRGGLLRKIFGVAMTLMLAIACVALYGCGGPSSLEDVVSKSELQEIADKAHEGFADFDPNCKGWAQVNGNILEFGVQLTYSADTLMGSGTTSLIQLVGEFLGVNDYLRAQILKSFDPDDMAASIADIEREYGFEGVEFRYYVLDSQNNIYISVAFTSDGATWID